MTRLTLQGDGAGAVKAFTDLKKAVDTAEKSIEKTVGSAKQLETAAGRIVKANESPLEKYNRRMAELGALVAKGKLSFDDAARAAQRYSQQLERAEARQKSTFGSSAVAQVSQMVAGYASLTRVIGLVTDKLRDVEQQAQASADSVFESLASAGELQQLAENPEQFLSLVSESRQLIARGIVRPKEKRKAYETVFNLQSAGFNKQEREALYGAAEAKQVADITALGGKLRGAQDVFGAEDTGDIGETLDKVLAISKATLENATKTAEQIPNFGSEARALGIDFDTAAAAYIAIRKGSSSAELAATRERALFAQIDKAGLYKGDLPSTIAAIEQRIAKGESAYGVLGNVRAVAGFRALTTAEGQKIFAEQLPNIQNAKGLISRQNFLNSDPTLAASSFRETAEGQLDATIESLDARRESLYDAFVAAKQAKIIRDQGGSGWASWASKATMGWSDFFETENSEFAFALKSEKAGIDTGLKNVSIPGPNGTQVNLLQAIADYLRDVAESNRNMDKKSAARAATRDE